MYCRPMRTPNVIIRKMLFAAVLLQGLLFASTAAAETTAFINVNVIPMTGETVLRDKTVIVSGGRIQQISDVDETPIPEDILVVDGTDRYLMPGLSEMHGHIPAADSDLLRRVLHLYVVNGITLTREI